MWGHVGFFEQGRLLCSVVESLHAHVLLLAVRLTAMGAVNVEALSMVDVLCASRLCPSSVQATESKLGNTSPHRPLQQAATTPPWADTPCCLHTSTSSCICSFLLARAELLLGGPPAPTPRCCILRTTLS